ncbi:hypothetical protein D1872_267000 [compost metagenome]
MHKQLGGHIRIQALVLKSLVVTAQEGLNVNAVSFGVALRRNVRQCELQIIVEYQVNINLILLYSFDLQRPVSLLWLEQLQ